MSDPAPPVSSAPPARSEDAVFAELASLCTSPGYVYALALVSLENNLTHYQESLKPDDLLKNYAYERLIRTELCTLFGLLVKAPVDWNYQGDVKTAEYAARSAQLLEELHSAMNGPMDKYMHALANGESPAEAISRGDFLREAIFYGAESAFLFQYLQLAIPKYQADDPWLIANKGFTIEQAHAVLNAILELLPGQIQSSLAAANGGEPIRAPMECLTLHQQNIIRHSGMPADVVELVLAAMSVSANERNTAFNSASDFNIVNAAPLLRNPDGRVTVFHSMSVGEALYETPFFWMTQDKKYFNTVAQDHRGEFLEQFCLRHLEGVFGADRVHANVELIAAGGAVDGEMDVLVLYGDRAVVVQAKSKRLTVAARKGIDASIHDDFSKSVQKAYDQGLECAKRLLSSAHTLQRRGGAVVTPARQIKRVYILCVLSDHYPALAFQARNMIKIEAVDAVEPPFVMDLFFLDELAEFLTSPLHFMSYINRRVGYNERIIASHEHVLLAYHLKKNLWLDSGTDMMQLTDDVAVELDIAMLARRAGEAGTKTPPGILTLPSGTAVARITQLLDRSDDPVAIELGLMLLTLDGDSMKAASSGIERIIGLARRDRKVRDFTMPLKGKSGGLTIHCGNNAPAAAKDALVRHCAKRKYMAESRSWFGVWLGPGTFEIRAIVALSFEWQPDNVMLEAIHTMTRGPYPENGVSFALI